MGSGAVGYIEQMINIPENIISFFARQVFSSLTI